jgi:phosphoribosylformimino-5-aminoimidazole carboxamide ribotide isomerase
MILFPAIDLRDGKCVRLYQGDYGRETVYGTDPVDQARRFVAEGAEAIHVVDLDAARTGKPTNRPVIAAICDAVSAPVQVGGGVRSTAAADELFAVGVHRVVIGTAALENPSLVTDLAGRGRRVAVGLDARGDEVATHGWTERTGRTVGEMAQQFADSGVEALIVTEISRDGTLAGPDVDGLSRLLAATAIPVLASGGVGSLEDLTVLSTIAVGHGDDRRRFAGVIVGRAFYEGAFTLPQALDAVAGRTQPASTSDRKDSRS